jgi:hypothetical protein
LKLKDFNSHDQGLSSVFWEKPLRRQPWIDFVDDMFYAKKPLSAVGYVLPPTGAQLCK